MNPYLIGITLAASISSTATFVINPGFVYTHGLSAYLHYGVAASLVPILFGVLCKNKLPVWLMATAAIPGLSLHLLFGFLGGVVNPAVSASYGIIISAAYAAICLLAIRMLAGPLYIPK